MSKPTSAPTVEQIRQTFAERPRLIPSADSVRRDCIARQAKDDIELAAAREAARDGTIGSQTRLAATEREHIERRMADKATIGRAEQADANAARESALAMALELREKYFGPIIAKGAQAVEAAAASLTHMVAIEMSLRNEQTQALEILQTIRSSFEREFGDPEAIAMAERLGLDPTPSGATCQAVVAPTLPVVFARKLNALLIETGYQARLRASHCKD